MLYKNTTDCEVCVITQCDACVFFRNTLSLLRGKRNFRSTTHLRELRPAEEIAALAEKVWHSSLRVFIQHAMHVL